MLIESHVHSTAPEYSPVHIHALFFSCSNINPMIKPLTIFSFINFYTQISSMTESPMEPPFVTTVEAVVPSSHPDEPISTPSQPQTPVVEPPFVATVEALVGSSIPNQPNSAPFPPQTTVSKRQSVIIDSLDLEMTKDEEVTNSKPHDSSKTSKRESYIECLDLEVVNAEEIQRVEDRVSQFMRGRSLVSNLTNYFEHLGEATERGRSSTWL